MYVSRERIVVCPMCRTSTGAAVASEPYLALASNVCDEELGRAVPDSLRGPVLRGLRMVLSAPDRASCVSVR